MSAENLDSALGSNAAAPRRWKPIAALERRVLGVLMEKAKTTPEQYPMTINGLCTGCNQKSNRFPQMDVDADDLEPVIENLKKLGAATEVQGSGRALKYRHHFYEWLGVNKAESAVMTELLLRGAQTEGELRTRAARMEAIADLAALRTILDGLRKKDLVISLTPAGRGQLISHALYEPRELEKLRAEAGRMSPGDEPDEPKPRPSQSPAREHVAAPVAERPLAVSRSPVGIPAATSGAPSESGEALLRQHNAMRAEIGQLRSDLDDLTGELRRCMDEIRQLKDSLGG